MRKGERARVMIKPKSGYGYEPYKDTIIYPLGWDSGENKQ